VDVDAMFVQCAVLSDPERLAGEDLILVGGSPQGRGVVTSASYGCRAFGVRSAISMASAVRLCPSAIVVPVPGEMVRKKSRQLRIALQHWSPVAVMASVDEAYLDLSGTEVLYRHEPLEETARRIQRDLKLRTGLDVSIGGATNRLVAKLATSYAKPAGVFVVPPGDEACFVARLEIADLIGVGPTLVEDLRRHGVTTMSALRALELETLGSWWGEDRARWLWRVCRGMDDSPVAARAGAKSISSETTFRRDIVDLDSLERILRGLVVDVAESLRKQSLFARTITVKLRDREFRDRSRSRTVREAVQSDRVIYELARALLRELRERHGKPARLIGVSLGNFASSGEDEQRSLLELARPLEGERDRAVSRAVDLIRARHGEVIGPGSVIADPERRRRSAGGGPDPSPAQSAQDEPR
jgi:DNA polymerase IV